MAQQNTNGTANAEDDVTGLNRGLTVKRRNELQEFFKVQTDQEAGTGASSGRAQAHSGSTSQDEELHDGLWKVIINEPEFSEARKYAVSVCGERSAFSWNSFDAEEAGGLGGWVRRRGQWSAFLLRAVSEWRFSFSRGNIRCSGSR